MTEEEITKHIYKLVNRSFRPSKHFRDDLDAYVSGAWVRLLQKDITQVDKADISTAVRSEMQLAHRKRLKHENEKHSGLAEYLNNPVDVEMSGDKRFLRFDLGHDITPERIAEHSDTLKKIADKVKDEPLQRDIVDLWLKHGYLTYADLSDILGMSVGYSLSHAINEIRRKINEL